MSVNLRDKAWLSPQCSLGSVVTLIRNSTLDVNTFMVFLWEEAGPGTRLRLSKKIHDQRKWICSRVIASWVIFEEIFSLQSSFNKLPPPSPPVDSGLQSGGYSHTETRTGPAITWSQPQPTHFPSAEREREERVSHLPPHQIISWLISITVPLCHYVTYCGEIIGKYSPASAGLGI